LQYIVLLAVVSVAAQGSEPMKPRHPRLIRVDFDRQMQAA
jgi:hypothetical protein